MSAMEREGVKVRGEAGCGACGGGSGGALNGAASHLRLGRLLLAVEVVEIEILRRDRCAFARACMTAALTSEGLAS